MIAGLIARVAASRLTRTALRCGLLIAAVLLFLLSIRRAGERIGRLKRLRGRRLLSRGLTVHGDEAGDE